MTELLYFVHPEDVKRHIEGHLNGGLTHEREISDAHGKERKVRMPF